MRCLGRRLSSQTLDTLLVDVAPSSRDVKYLHFQQACDNFDVIYSCDTILHIQECTRTMDISWFLTTGDSVKCRQLYVTSTFNLES